MLHQVKLSFRLFLERRRTELAVDRGREGSVELQVKDDDVILEEDLT